ncbi:MAG: permease prefix domain 2-containing transporter [Cyclobacteriaceae bacterium]
MDNHPHKPHPPRWADRLLESFCAPHLLEEVQGDLYELYGGWVQEYGARKANRLYVFHTLKFFRPNTMRKKTMSSPMVTVDMIRNYLTIAWRNLFIHRLYSFLNITGLAVGLACGILLLLWLNHEISYDKFHQNLSDIHLMMRNQMLGGKLRTGDATPAPLSAALREQFPEIKYASCTGGGGEKLFSLGEETTYASGLYAEPDFFNMMTFPAIAGDPVAALRDPGSLIITESTARNWFDEEEPLGKMVRLNNTHDLQVAAIIRDAPSNSTLRFDVVLPFRLLEQESELKWDNNSFLTWVQLQPNTDLDQLNGKVAGLLNPKLDGEEMELFAYPLANMHLFSSFKDGKPDGGGKIAMVIMLGSLCFFIVLIACINFMNLATARSERRAREVGVRKVMGAQRRLIIGQFLSEAMVMTFLGLALSILIVNLTLPAYNQLIRGSLEFNFSNWQIWSMLLGLGLITGLVAGSYPAFFLSAFQPVRVLKGVIATGRKAAWLRKGLVSFQFFISIFFIITTIVIFTQLEYIQHRPLGYDQENLIEITAQGDMSQRFDLVKHDLLQLPGVSSVSAGTDNLLRMGGGLTGFQWPGKTPDQDFGITVTWVNYDWVETAGLSLIEGRDFSTAYSSDSSACLLNEAAVERMGLEDPVGTMVGDNNTVIGVVKDFIYNSPTVDPHPMVVFFRKGNLNHFFVRFQNDQQWRDRLAQIEQVVKTHNPDYPVEFHFTKDEYQRNFDEMQAGGQMATLFSGLAIFIACLGLVGLSAFVAEQRKKEIGIRKVLGATVPHISFSLSHDFFQPVLWAFILAAPVAGWAMQQMLNEIDYHIELSWWMFALAGVLALIIAMLTVGFQSVKAALANPVDSLRNE